LERLIPAAGLVTVVVKGRDHPCLPQHVKAAAQLLGVSEELDWVLRLGTGDDLQRAVFFLLLDGRAQWVLKFSRVAGANESFIRDETGLALAQDCAAAAAHAPEHLGRMEISGLAASLETAAPGRPLLELLQRQPLTLIDSIAEWIIRVGHETATPASALQFERSRLLREVTPRWRGSGVRSDLVENLLPVPGVLQHNDLGSWNIVTDGRGFVAVDWESAKPIGLPLWDLLYFLADVLARMEGPANVDILLDRTLRLFAGGSQHSLILFRWVREAVSTLRIPPQAVGGLATLCWMQHGLSADSRASALGGAPMAPAGHLALLAPQWLAHPSLGPTWSSWLPE